MKFTSLLFLIFAIIFTPACARQDFHLTKKFRESEIEKSTLDYATIDYSNPIEIWEQEFGVGRVLSNVIDYSLPKKLKLDVYGPKDDKVRPAIIFLHGGAFLPMKGSKKDASIVKFAYEFAQRGYRVFSVEYRDMNILAPSFLKGGYMAAQDAKAALRYIANQSKELKVHPKKFFIGGISAGAITALNATFLDQGEPILGRGEKFDRMYGCLDCVGESSFTDYKILGVINIAGGVYDLSILDNNKVPVISFHGDADNIVPHDKGIPFESVSEYYNQFLNTLVNQAEKYNYPNLAREMQEGKVSEMIGSKQIHRHLKSKRRTSEYHEIPGGSHYLVLSDNNAFMQKGVEMVDKISKFMYRRLK